MADLTISDVRAKYPQYDNLSDQQLAESLHKKFYSDLPFEEFSKKIGYFPSSSASAASAVPIAVSDFGITPEMASEPGVLRAIGAGMATGMAEPVLGAAEYIPGRVGQEAAAMNRAIQAGWQKEAEEHPVAARAGYYPTAILPWMAAPETGVAERAASALGLTGKVAPQLAKGAATGAGMGALAPTEQGRYTAEGAKQTAKNVLSGAAVGGILQSIGPAIKVVRAPAEMKVAPETRAAIEAGYVFPPSVVAGLKGEPGAGVEAAAGAGGKIKTRQLASQKNQTTTNRLAAEDIGLPGNTQLNDAAFELARRPAAAVYEEVRQAVPQIELSSEFVNKTQNIGKKGSLLEKWFPESATSPAIEDVKTSLLRYGPGKPVDTSAVMMKVADLRREANISLKTVGDAQRHQLGIAQREAADILEDSLYEGVKNAPQYFAKRAETANQTVSNLSRQLQVIEGTVPAESLSAEEQQLANWAKNSPFGQAHVESVKAELSQAQAQAAEFSQRLQEAEQKGSALQTLPDRYKAARQLFAKTYDLEGVTNLTTGEVNAHGLARLYKKGKPLSGNLKTIADAANISPQSTQMPSRFGYSEDYSALDFFGIAHTAVAGKLGDPKAIAALGAQLSRPFVRKRLLSPAYQRAMAGLPPALGPDPAVFGAGSLFPSAVTPSGVLSTLGVMQPSEEDQQQ
jgi:hypothetical protein